MARKSIKKRVREEFPEDETEANLDPYGVAESNLERFSSGCVLLDCVLGDGIAGGWVENRVMNVIGDRSTGKTLLAIEACATFNAKHKGNCEIEYRDIEEVFDREYATNIGLPLDRVSFKPRKKTDEDEENVPALETVEDFAEDMEEIILEREGQKNLKPMLYIVDSLDALSDRAEKDREMGQRAYDTKSAVLSRFFREYNGRMSRAKITLFVISQVREAIGVTFGEKYRRSGGKSLDFYAVHALWLANHGQIKKTRQGIERTVGLSVKAKCKKNKAGPAFRECMFPIIFGYGIEDVQAGIEWLLEVKKHAVLNMSEKEAKSLAGKVDMLDAKAHAEEKAVITKVVPKVWNEIEALFKIPRRKYADPSA